MESSLNDFQWSFLICFTLILIHFLFSNTIVRGRDETVVKGTVVKLTHLYISTTRIRDMNLVRVWFIFESLVLVPFWQKFRCTQCNLYSDPNQFYFLTNPNIHFYFQKNTSAIIRLELYKLYSIIPTVYCMIPNIWNITMSQYLIINNSL